MTGEAAIPQLNIAELFFQVYRYGSLNRDHRQQLKFILLKESISEEEQTAIDRLLYAVRRGWLKISD